MFKHFSTRSKLTKVDWIRTFLIRKMTKCFTQEMDKHWRNGIVLIVGLSIAQPRRGYNTKSSWIIATGLRGRPINITIIQVYTPTIDAEEVEIESFCAWGRAVAQLESICSSCRKFPGSIQLNDVPVGDVKDLFLRPREPLFIWIDKTDSYGLTVRFRIRQLHLFMCPGRNWSPV